MSLRAKFNELEDRLLNERDKLDIHIGVPFILLIYPPSMEHECRARQIELKEKLEARGLDVIEHELSTFIFDHYEEEGILDDILRLDRERPDELRRMIAQEYEPKLRDRILETAGKADENSVIFLTRVATMYPFARVSNLLADLENEVHVPLVVFYPGYEQDGQLSFLGIEPHVGYRALRI